MVLKALLIQFQSFVMVSILSTAISAIVSLTIELPIAALELGFLSREKGTQKATWKQSVHDSSF